MKENVIQAQTEADALINLETAFNDAVKARCSDCHFCKMSITDDGSEIMYLCCRKARKVFAIPNAYLHFICEGFKDCGMIARHLREKAWEKYVYDISLINLEESNVTH